MNKTIDIIGAPVAYGQRKLGVDFGPDAIRYAGLLNRLKALELTFNDKGNIPVPNIDLERYLSEQEGAHNLPEIIEVSKTLSEATSESVAQSHFPLTLGGDHSLAIGSISGISQHYEKSRCHLV